LRVKIPQNVEREDQIIFFITMRQLIILIVGGGITYFIFSFFQRNFPWESWMWIPIVFCGAITAAIAFFKFNELDFVEIILLLLEKVFLTNKQIWQNGADSYFLAKNLDLTQKKKDNNEQEKEKINNKDLSKMVDVLDKQSVITH